MILPPLARPAGASGRWALSFADLCLLLLGFLLLLQAHRGDPAALSAGLRAAFGASAPARMVEEGAAPLFQPGEAVLRPAARARFAALGRSAAADHAQATIESLGSDAGGARLDAWELAAARAAAVARALQAGGLDAAAIEVSVAATGPASALKGQRLRLTLSPALAR